MSYDSIWNQRKKNIDPTKEVKNNSDKQQVVTEVSGQTNSTSDASGNGAKSIDETTLPKPPVRGRGRKPKSGTTLADEPKTMSRSISMSETEWRVLTFASKQLGMSLSEYLRICGFLGMGVLKSPNQMTQDEVKALIVRMKTAGWEPDWVSGKGYSSELNKIRRQFTKG